MYCKNTSKDVSLILALFLALPLIWLGFIFNPSLNRCIWPRSIVVCGVYFVARLHTHDTHTRALLKGIATSALASPSYPLPCCYFSFLSFAFVFVALPCCILQLSLIIAFLCFASLCFGFLFSALCRCPSLLPIALLLWFCLLGVRGRGWAGVGSTAMASTALSSSSRSLTPSLPRTLCFALALLIVALCFMLALPLPLLALLQRALLSAFCFGGSKLCCQLIFSN